MTQMARRQMSEATEPFNIGAYEFTMTGLVVHGEPTFKEHQSVGDFIQRAVKASEWWFGDWLRYGESREDWQSKDGKARLEQAVNTTGLSEKRLMNIRSVAAIDPSRRRETVEFGLHAELAGMEPAEQTRWLDRIESNGWNRAELRNQIRAAARTRVIKGQAHLEGMYRVIYADPPWLYGDRGATEDGSLGKAERHYPGMTIDELCALPVQAHALENSVLFCWVTATMLYENPGPREVIEAWGFKPKTGHVWHKVLGNYGHYSHVVHEHLIVATRGSCLPDEPTPSPKSVTTIRRDGEHSEKPEDFRLMIEKQYTTGPYLELFGRKPKKGWSVFGNDPRLWAEQAKPPIEVNEDDLPF
jgi:N6-adenosine-specific RNA methylase IME4